MAEPIKVTLYDENDEIIAEHSRRIIPWGILKKALKFKDLDKANISDKDMDSMADLLCEIFGDKLTIADIDKYMDIGDVMSVIGAITVRAASMMSGSIPNAMAGK
jgi:hypothetical protein